MGYSETRTEQKRYLGRKGTSVDVLDSQEYASPPSTYSQISPPNRTLSPVSASGVNSIRLVTESDQKPLNITYSTSDMKDRQLGRMNSYEAAMNSRQSQIEATNSQQSNGYTISSQVNGRRTNGSSNTMAPRSPVTAAASVSVRAISSEFGPSRLAPAPPSKDASSTDENTPWSGAVGRATLGKSGRVIEKLMSENDHLKRDLHATKLAAEESRNDAKMYQGSMEGLRADKADAEHQLGVKDMLLKRKERQLGEYKDMVDGERRKANIAIESEKNWRVAMEKLEQDTKRKVDEATNLAMMADARYNTLASHWKDEGKLVDSTVTKLQGEIAAISKERVEDRIDMRKLEIVCEQQAHELTILTLAKNELERKFEDYKNLQEEALSGIKTTAKDQEDRSAEILGETQRVLGELKWALGVRQNVRDAQ